MPNCLPKWLYHSTFPPGMHDSSCHSTFSQVLGIVSVLEFGHSNRLQWYIVFVLIYSIMGYLYMFIFHLYPSFGNCLLRSFAPFKIRLFFYLLVSFKSSLCIVEGPLSDVSSANIFLHNLSSHSPDSSFHEMEVFNFSKDHFLKLCL